MAKLSKSLLFAAVLLFSQVIFVSVAPAACGDGAVDAGEDCDDGDTDFASGELCGADCTVVSCGHASGSAGVRPIATDALFALQAVVGIETCDSCVCDTDGSGQATATDVLRILAAAVGQEITLTCGACTDLVRHGVLTLTSVIPIVESARDAMLQERAEIESLGLILADDGSLVSAPETPARGWLLRMGEKLILSDAAGAFTVALSRNDPTVGSIAHPAQPDDPVFELRMDELARPEDPPTEIEMELAFAGPCGMNADPAFPDPPTCDEILGGASTAALDAHHHHGPPGPVRRRPAQDERDGEESSGENEKAETDAIAASEFDPEDAVAVDRMGFYPLGNQSCCRQYDGPTSSQFDLGTVEGTLFNYFASTCHLRVFTGCCANELGSLTAAGLKAIGALEQVSCVHNHKGRYCQEIVQGDLSVDTDGVLVRDGTSYQRPVRLGERVDMIVHNNGCFGTTFIEKTRNEIQGRFEGTFVSEELGRALHFTGSPPNLDYEADRDFEYVVPACVSEFSGNALDTYVFKTDGVDFTIRFRLKTGNLWRFEDGSVFSADDKTVSPPNEDCQTYHVRGAHPCTGDADPGDPCGHGVVTPVAVCGDDVLDVGEDCESTNDFACPGQCEACECPGPVCGNQVIEPGEECDGQAFTPDCVDGVCRLDCTCSECGNGRIDAPEDCDGADLGGATCEDFDRVSGALMCDENCAFDFTECLSPACGNDLREADEECDGSDNAACGGGDVCGPECSCVPPGCGDGVVGEGEQCDSEDFFCHGGTCLEDCGCDNACSNDGDCAGGDVCIGLCVSPCDGPGDCQAGELCIVPGSTPGGDLLPGCSPPMSGGAAVGADCGAADECGSYTCPGALGECSEFCSVGPGGDSECPNQACVELLPGTGYGLCGTECGSDGDCGTGRVCGLTADTSDNAYEGACVVAAGVGALGDSCAANSECDTGLCMTPPPSPAFCSTGDQCGAGEVCTPFFVCAFETCTAFCESNDDCGGSLPTCTEMPFLRPGGGDPDVLNFCAP
jgi:hypothetical protein